MKGRPLSGGKKKTKRPPTIAIITRGHHLRLQFWTSYNSWWAMIDRCYREGNVMHYMYGGAGVSVCERWFDFEKFLEDMGKRPKGKTLDRFPNSDGNYEPGNVRWATAYEQGINRKTTRLTEDLVQEIWGRHEHRESNASIAKRMGVARCHISLILSGDKWKGSKLGYPEPR